MNDMRSIIGIASDADLRRQSTIAQLCDRLRLVTVLNMAGIVERREAAQLAGKLPEVAVRDGLS